MDVHKYIQDRVNELKDKKGVKDTFMKNMNMTMSELIDRITPPFPLYKLSKEDIAMLYALELHGVRHESKYESKEQNFNERDDGIDAGSSGVLCPEV